MDLIPGFWKTKKVFITGHTGFKGSWLVLWLLKFGSHVTGYALRPQTHPNLFEAAKVSEQTYSVEGDVRDGDALRKALQEARPDIVIHLAAQSLVRASYDDPISTLTTNVMGTAQLLECCRHIASVRTILVVTSDKCYENRQTGSRYTEHAPMGGFDPYSSSKGCAELVTASYRQSFFRSDEVGIATARAGNVLGGGDWSAERLIPDMARAFSRGETLLVRNPESVRPWQHVLEPLRGYLTLLEALFDRPSQHSEAWNFGPESNNEKPVSWLADYCCHRWGNAKWEAVRNDQKHEACCLLLDSSKARRFLHWNTNLSMENTLDWVVDWYKEYYESKNARALCEYDIARYQNLEESFA